MSKAGVCCGEDVVGRVAGTCGADCACGELTRSVRSRHGASTTSCTTARPSAGIVNYDCHFHTSSAARATRRWVGGTPSAPLPAATSEQEVRSAVDFEQLEADSALLASALSSSDGPISTLLRQRREQWTVHDAFVSTSASVVAQVNQTAGAGSLEPIGVMQTDGSAKSQFEAARRAVANETNHLKELEQQVARHRSAIEVLKRKARNLRIAIACAVAAGGGFLIFLLSKLAG